MPMDAERRWRTMAIAPANAAAMIALGRLEYGIQPNRTDRLDQVGDDRFHPGTAGPADT